LEPYGYENKVHFSLNADAIDCKEDGDLVVDTIKGRARLNDRENEVTFQCDFGVDPDYIIHGGGIPASVFHNLRAGVFIGQVSKARDGRYDPEYEVANGNACVFRVNDFGEQGQKVTPDRLTVTVCDGKANGVFDALFGDACYGYEAYRVSDQIKGGNIQYHLSNRSGGQACAPAGNPGPN
jgi:hypothetical protein